MEQRDYMMRQIEQLGQALARMLARLLNIKQLPPSGLSIDEIKNVYSDELDLSLDLILQAPKEEIVGILNSGFNFIDQHREKMAEIMGETADLYEQAGQGDIARDLREKCIVIYEHIQENSGSYSLERVMKISALKDLL